MYRPQLHRTLVIIAIAGLTAIACAQSEPNDPGLTGGSGGTEGSQPPAGSPDPGPQSDAAEATGGSEPTTGLAGTTGGIDGGAGTTGDTGGAGATGIAGTTFGPGNGGGGGDAGGGRGGAAVTGRGGVSGTGGGPTSAPDGGASDAGAAPTFTQVYTTVLSVYCAGSSCHDPGTKGSVSFSSQANAYKTLQSKLKPGNAASSTLYTLVNSGKMPEGRPKLSAANIALIKAWIDAGALDN